VLPFDLLLAIRFMRGAVDEKNVATMVKVCITSITIGTFSLALVAAIMQGIETATRVKLQGMHPDIIIRSPELPIDYEKLSNVLKSDYQATIVSCAPSSSHNALISASGTGEDTVLVMVVGIDPASYGEVTKLASMIVGQDNFKTIFEDPHAIIIGAQLAGQLGVEKGDEVTLLFPESLEAASGTIHLEACRVRVRSMFKSGISEFDRCIIFCSLPFFETMFPDKGIQEVGIRLKPHACEQTVLTKVRELTQLQVYSWKELYLPLFSALVLEKYAMYFILLLIALVASMNIIALLFMYIAHKKAEIALLKAMGMPDSTIRKIFMYVGMMIVGVSAIIGLLCAYIVCIFLEWYPCIQLPDVYYVSHLPATMTGSIICSVITLVTLLGLVAIWLPIRSIASISISSLLRE
jgi:lipoprotein-releasing system permease protein